MATTIGEVISRIRNQLKAVKQDPFLTDRYIFSLISKHAHWLMKREDSKNKLMRFASVIQTLDNIELIEVDKVEACCTRAKSDCLIKRTKDKIPSFMQGYYGPLIRAVTSLDGSEIVKGTNPSTYVSMTHTTSFKYNKTKYFWFLNDYLYFPDFDWDAIRIEGIFEDDITGYNCTEDDDCIIRQLQQFNVPDYLHGEIESNVIKDFGLTIQLPGDTTSDKQHILR
jgi:hypothetical protein